MRKSVTDGVTSSADMLEPLQGVDGDLESLNDWLEDADRMLTSYEHSDTDVETQYQAHQVSLII